MRDEDLSQIDCLGPESRRPAPFTRPMMDDTRYQALESSREWKIWGRKQSSWKNGKGEAEGAKRAERGECGEGQVLAGMMDEEIEGGKREM